MLPTPSTTHIDERKIYEPAEDSFLFLDTLSSPAEVLFLTQRFGPSAKRDAAPLIVEIGTGSGVIIAFLTAHAHTLFGTTHVLTAGTDVNWFACKDSQETVRRASNLAVNASGSERPSTAGYHGEFLGTLNGDLASPLRPGTVDLLLFNPPYVPSSDVPGAPMELHTEGDDQDLKRDSNLLSLSYEGGLEGMEVTQRLLDQLESVLNKRTGVAYVLLCKQNRPDEVISRLRSEPCWTVDIVGKSGSFAGWERLQIIRVCRQCETIE